MLPEKQDIYLRHTKECESRPLRCKIETTTFTDSSMAEAPPDDIVEIVLERGNHGLGFNIRGGVDIPYVQEDSGIFVTKIREDGAAFLDGRLKEGDKILEINGHTLKRVTHNEAVQHFVNAGEVVTLKVQPGAEEAIQQQKENEENEQGSRNSTSSSRRKPSNAFSTNTLVYISLGAVAAAAAVGFFYFKMRR
ncbi:disks large homolog 1-like isoform X1 [Ostrea edulis]|uniref:disks large homolog 1-like isoform X1 n=1 Tax=Ostrea edulis TaxID=37623 RepID=UPI0024AFDD84|nr:disks large homolog 1-like isoform X1 [Ostrea edulis]